ncbi:unnamed protein product [Staurois parvus]|uniref:Uncharacterized protein n=1 Tax=Staurois parvus TaxID=386267 RepID=A0ABN9CXN3_9NEOB|nr:unnamed protein product [Staurois parvus]
MNFQDTRGPTLV